MNPDDDLLTRPLPDLGFNFPGSKKKKPYAPPLSKDKLPVPGAPGESFDPTRDDGGYGSGGTIEGPRWVGGGGPSGGGGIFSHPGVTATPAAMWDDDGLSKSITDRLRSVWENGETAYSPEVVASMKSDLQSAVAGKVGAASDAATTDAVSRGMGRSSALGADLADIQMGGAAAYGAGVGDILQQKAMADFEQKMTAINMAEQDLQREQARYLQMDMHQIERDRLEANTELAWMNIQQQKEMLMAQLQASWQSQLLAREPIEGRDYIVIGGRKVPLAALGTMGNWLT